MAPFSARVYTDEQRDAIAEAYEDRRIRPASKVVNLARAGDLLPGLAAFEVTGGDNTVRDFARRLRKRRAGEHASATAKLPPANAVEAMRQRLVSAADHELARWERKQKIRGVTAKQALEITDGLRSVARLVKEAASLPGPDDPRPPARKTNNPEQLPQPETATQHAAILRSHSFGARSNGQDREAMDRAGEEPETKRSNEEQEQPSHEQALTTEQPGQRQPIA